MNHSSDNFKARSEPSREAERLIEGLQLTRHPEGGWYRETWRSPHTVGERAAGSAILFLLDEGQRSQWHRVDADEFWLWHVGAALDLGIATPDGSAARRVAVGPGALLGEEPQVLIPAGHWQTATAARGWTLVSCLVIPGFDFAGFTLAPPQWAAQLDTAIAKEG